MELVADIVDVVVGVPDVVDVDEDVEGEGRSRLAPPTRRSRPTKTEVR